MPEALSLSPVLQERVLQSYSPSSWFWRLSNADLLRGGGVEVWRWGLAKPSGLFQVRCDPEIQELRQWQKKLREDKHIRQRVKIFWAKQEQKREWWASQPTFIPEKTDPSPEL